jgi:hypothetical protein
MLSDAQIERKALFGSHAFQINTARALELPPGVVRTAFDAVVASGAVPSSFIDNSDALAFEGAMKMLALGSRQSRPDAIVRMLERLGTMTHQFVVRNGTGEESPEREAPSPLFAPPSKTSCERRGGSLADRPVRRSARSGSACIGETSGAALSSASSTTWAAVSTSTAAPRSVSRWRSPPDGTPWNCRQSVVSLSAPCRSFAMRRGWKAECMERQPLCRTTPDSGRGDPKLSPVTAI